MRLFLAFLTVMVCLAPTSSARASDPSGVSAGVQWIASDFFDRAAPDWKLGMGFNLTGLVQVNDALDLRGDLGFRWSDGESRLIGDSHRGPDWGGQPGERTDGIRVMPATLDLVYRFETLSRDRYWVPFAGAGLGFYDMEARFQQPDGLERKHNLFRFGWNLRTGVTLHRTSGMFVSVESALHLVDLPQRWTPIYDIGLGFGAVLPRR